MGPISSVSSNPDHQMKETPISIPIVHVGSDMAPPVSFAIKCINCDKYTTTGTASTVAIATNLIMRSGGTSIVYYCAEGLDACVLGFREDWKGWLVSSYIFNTDFIFLSVRRTEFGIPNDPR
jgi:hypothetical protein